MKTPEGAEFLKYISTPATSSGKQLSRVESLRIISAEPDSMKNTLHRLRDEYGSAEGYFIDYLGFKPQDIETLKAKYLEPASKL